MRPFSATWARIGLPICKVLVDLVVLGINGLVCWRKNAETVGFTYTNIWVCSIHPLHSMPQELRRSLTCRWNVRNPAASTRWGSPVAENRAKMGPVVATKRCSSGVEDQQNGGHMLLQWLHIHVCIHTHDSVYVIQIEWGIDDWPMYIRPIYMVDRYEPREPCYTGHQDAWRVVRPGKWR